MRRRRPALTAAGGSRAWTKMVQDYVQVHPLCWLRFPRCTLRATTIDHFIPMKYRPDLAEIEGNWRPACSYCNRARRETLPEDIPKLRAKLEARSGKRIASTALEFFK